MGRPPAPRPGGWFGSAIALSREGTTALIGAPDRQFNSSPQGTAHVLVADPTSTWTEEPLPIPSTLPLYHRFGVAVDLSADGTTAVVGATTFNYGEPGQAYVFVRGGSCGPAGSWSPTGSSWAHSSRRCRYGLSSA